MTTTATTTTATTTTTRVMLAAMGAVKSVPVAVAAQIALMGVEVKCAGDVVFAVLGLSWDVTSTCMIGGITVDRDWHGYADGRRVGQGGAFLVPSYQIDAVIKAALLIAGF